MQRLHVWFVHTCRLPVLQRAQHKGKAAAEAAAAQQAAEADEARRRFGNAKSISSSMFNEEGGAGNNDYERTARLSKFQVGHVSLSGTTVSQSTRAL